MPSFQQRIAKLQQTDANGLFKNILRGVEKESLRVTHQGGLALTPHPTALGSTLTHPQITTDYSEALLEFITPPSTSVADVLKTLDNIHRYTYQNIGEELLWVNSMPCQLGTDNDIPVGQYGHSNIGRMKTIYRVGLGHRYGRLMQTIAGIHYNFSLPEIFWQWLQQQEAPDSNLQDFTTERYFALIRNFRRYFPLLLFLFGAAPAVCRSFVKDRQHSLESFNGDPHSLHKPYATSLRMGDLGYQSKAQETLVVCYNELDTYIRTLRGALTESYPPYQQIGLKDSFGDYRQLSTNLLQIENEFYSTIRPKRNANSGETPLNALHARGVEYIEVRCLDLNPYLPVGISEQQIHFLDSFLVFCLLEESPATDAEETANILENQRRTVYYGRDPELTLLHKGQEKPIAALIAELFTRMEPVSALLDSHQQTTAHGDAIKAFKMFISKPELTASAQILNEMRTKGQTYFEVAMNHARQHRQYFLDKPPAPDIVEQYQQMAVESLKQQRAIEVADEIDFDTFLANYYRQYDNLTP